MKIERLFRIVNILLSRGTVTAPALAHELEVSVRTIYRDIETLGLSGIPVYSVAGNGGGIRLIDGYTIDKSLLTRQEQDTIISALKSFDLSGSLKSAALIDKLGAMFKNSSRDWILINISRWSNEEFDKKRFNLLKQCIVGCEELNIVYCSSSGKTDKRTVWPLLLEFRSSSWYLNAFCLKADGFRMFKINRILEMSPAGKHFSPPEPPPAPKAQNTFFKAKMISAVLWFPKELSFRVYDEFLPGDVTQSDDGGLIVSLTVTEDSWIYGYLLSFGPKVRVISPPQLKSKLLKLAKQTLESYET